MEACLEVPLSLVSIKVTQAELMPANLWCSITVNLVKLSWLSINQCHMFTERWAALLWDILKPSHGSETAGGLLNADLRRHWDRLCDSVTLLSVFANLGWANNERCSMRWTSNISRILSVCTSISRHTVHHFYEGQVAMETQEEMANDSMFT